ncbi:MATE family efflux transporter [Comamonas serinivorans]|uniref:MATE family efflux transporter n=1 Tax=Comamonas serinivorans TaxID=1082851 RepID=A0A1Y0ER02_9BURK|nr:MATE family efflux transporter [Comamonas serinivorans]ARU06087.1 MATE family efflux transporter [Comamonas serinivorans]
MNTQALPSGAQVAPPAGPAGVVAEPSAAPAAPAQPATLSGNPLLDAPIFPTLTRLAIPNTVALVMAVLVAIAETFYVGRLGTVPLAAMALVFPFVMLMGMLSNGAMGSGVSSAISRAFGSGDREKAAVLAVHAAAIGGGLGLIYTLVFVVGGATFYRALGGTGEVLAAATHYGQILFAGAVLVWLCNTLASVVRGTGNMRLPSIVLMAASAVQIVVGGVLALGLGPVPRWGMTGVAIGNIVAMALADLAFVAYLLWGQDKLRLPRGGVRLSWPMFRDILRVGAIACLSPLQTSLSALLFTGMVARLGPDALAGYGIGQRLEFLLIPIAFGIGMAAVPMVGMAMGAGQAARARRVAWTGAAMAAVLLGVIGVLVLIWPHLWSGIFTQSGAVQAVANQYLRTVGPGFALFGFGLVLYFSSLGAGPGHLMGVVLANTARLVFVAVGGWWLLHTGRGSAENLFVLALASMLVFGAATAVAVKLTPWRSPKR